MNKAKLKKLTTNLKDFNADVTEEERKIIEAEKKYYEQTLMSMAQAMGKNIELKLT